MRRHWAQGDQQRSKSRNLSSRWLAKTNTARTGMGRTAGLRWLCRGQARMTQWRVTSHLTEIDPFSFFLLMYTVLWYHKKFPQRQGGGVGMWVGSEVSVIMSYMQLIKCVTFWWYMILSSLWGSQHRSRSWNCNTMLWNRWNYYRSPLPD